MYIQDRIFLNDNQKREFINECERAFENQINLIIDNIKLRQEIKVLTLSGPTCSGKTITAQKLTGELTTAGKRVYKISIDDFYRNRNEIINEAAKLNKLPDYDTIKSIDFDTFSRCVNDIYDGKNVLLPLFNFKTGIREDYLPFNPLDYDIILFEGIQAVYPEVSSLLDDRPYISINTNVRDDIKVNDNIFTKREVRLIRRLVRDIRARNASPDSTFMMWYTTVVPNEDKNLLPYEDNAHFKINSLMPYEINVIKPFLLATLDKLKPGSEYLKTAQSFRERLIGVENINADYIPPESIYKEFIG